MRRACCRLEGEADEGYLAVGQEQQGCRGRQPGFRNEGASQIEIARGHAFMIMCFLAFSVAVRDLGKKIEQARRRESRKQTATEKPRKTACESLAKQK